VSGNFGFGFTPDPEEPNPEQGGFDMKQIGEMLQQLGSMMAHATSPDAQTSPVNWELATDAARKAIVSKGDPSVTDGQRSATETAVDLAEVWLDGVTDFPATGGRPATWSRSEWFTSTLPAWQQIIDPVAERVQDSMSGMLPGPGAAAGGMLPEGLPPELAQMMEPLLGMAKQMGATMFGMQIAQALAGLAGEVVSASDVGVPLTDDGRPALIPGNISSFGGGLNVPDRETLLFLALRESAHQRLFSHVSWLRPRILAAVDTYARGIGIDTERIESAMSGIDPSNPAAIQEVLASGVLAPEDTPEQRAALERLETLLALVEGWVDVVVTQAAGDRLESVSQLREAIRRRRAAGGPAERTFATLVGLELRPRKLREAAAMWEALEAARGQGGRDAVWAHPDLLPTAADLERPDTFVTATDPEAIADLERALGSLGQDIEALEMGTGPESPEAGESADGDTDEPGAASKD
jgi:putative hydrolase